jgi:hypothetical protein
MLMQVQDRVGAADGALQDRLVVNAVAIAPRMGPVRGGRDHGLGFADRSATPLCQGHETLESEAAKPRPAPPKAYRLGALRPPLGRGRV